MSVDATTALPEAPAAPEAEIVSDMLRRGLPAFPVIILIAGLVWGWNGAASAAFAVGLVVVNFVLTAVILSYTGRQSTQVLMAGVLIGYALRMGLVVVALVLVKDQPWAELVPLGITLIVTHLGLLFSELRHVSASLAFPGVKPPARTSPSAAPPSLEEASSS